MNTKTLQTIILTALVVVLGFIFVPQLKDKTLGGSAVNVPTFESAATSSAVTVGPQQNIQIVATTSSRSYLLLTNGSASTTDSHAIFCRADYDKAAVANQGIKLSSTTGMTYEFTADKGNLYVGAVRCTAAASTTLLLHEYKQRP